MCKINQNYCVHICVYTHTFILVDVQSCRMRSLKSNTVFNSSWLLWRDPWDLYEAGKELRPIYATLPRELPSKSTEGGLGYAAARYLLAAQERTFAGHIVMNILKACMWGSISISCADMCQICTKEAFCFGCQALECVELVTSEGVVCSRAEPCRGWTSTSWW